MERRLPGCKKTADVKKCHQMGRMKPKSDMSDLVFQRTNDRHYVLAGLVVDLMLCQRLQNVVGYGRVFLLADVHAAMRIRHAAAAILLRPAAARAEEIARMLFDFGKSVWVVAVGQEASLDYRIAHVRFDDVIHEASNSFGTTETFVQTVAHAVLHFCVTTVQNRGRTIRL
jgi:ABC-type thiamin/hydroxymethylpyrimidine transport system permease subunit